MTERSEASRSSRSDPGGDLLSVERAESSEVAAADPNLGFNVGGLFDAAVPRKGGNGWLIVGRETEKRFRVAAAKALHLAGGYGVEVMENFELKSAAWVGKGSLFLSLSFLSSEKRQNARQFFIFFGVSQNSRGP